MRTDQSDILDLSEISEISDFGDNNSPVNVSSVLDSLIVARLHRLIMPSFLFTNIGPFTVSNTICLSISITTSRLYLAMSLV